MRDDFVVEPLPYWMADALRRNVDSTATARLAIMDRVRRERANRLSTPSRPSRWRRRGSFAPIAFLTVLGMLFVSVSLRDVGQRADLTIMNAAYVIGDSVVPSRDTTPAAAGRPASFLDTLRIVEFVLRGGVTHSAVVVGDFNGWQRGATPMHRDGNGEWKTRALVPPDVLRYAYIVDDAQVITAPPLSVVRNATPVRHDSM